MRLKAFARWNDRNLHLKRFHALVLPEWPHLWVLPSQSTVIWRTESYAVSTRRPCLVVTETLNETHTPELQLRLDDSALGPVDSSVTMVRKQRPTMDSFQKWLDAYTSFMLVLVAAYPRRALELIKYQQIISKAVTKFKGMAWHSQFRERAAHNQSISWVTVDLELWTLTFSGLAKPHCSVCSSPYHTQDACPSADPNRKPRQVQSTVCFDFNKPSGCRCRNCKYPFRALALRQSESLDSL